MNSNAFRNQKNKIIYKEGIHAKLVALTDKGIIRKTYAPDQKDIFNHEVFALQTLQSCKFVPRLLYIDKEKITFYMSYCGSKITDLSKYQKKIKKYIEIMENDYNIYHND